MSRKKKPVEADITFNNNWLPYELSMPEGAGSEQSRIQPEGKILEKFRLRVQKCG